MQKHRVLVWFSCGAASAAASAVAAKEAVARWRDEPQEVVVVHCDTLVSEHPDNVRFKSDVEAWIGQPIVSVRSAKYSDIDDVFVRRRYMSGVSGAICTTELKKKPREEFQRPTDLHVFGFTSDESKRAYSFEERNPTLAVEHLLVDLGITKQRCLDMLSEAGIALPAMYGLGFDHNNCIGCVKSGSAGYWNRTRRLFPDVFARRAEQSRALGVRLVKLKGKRVFLDELPPDAYAPDDAIDCGPTCQVPERGES